MNVLVKGNISLTYYSSCAADETATEGVLTDLLSGYVPDLAGGGDFSVLRENHARNINPVESVKGQPSTEP